jgi:predicted nucleic acid-binding Zn ribbon protein
MTSKTAKSRAVSKPKMDTHQRRMKWLQTAFIVISALLVLSMVLAAVINR